MDRGLFNYLRPEQRAAIKQIASAQATFDPVTGGLGAATETMGRSVIGGVYKTRQGEIVDFTRLTSLLTKAKDFFASDFRVPIVGFNPADMLGNRSLTQARRSPVLQYVSSRSVQPFIPRGEQRPDFYLLNRTRGTKGTLQAFTSDNIGRLSVSTLPGQYRPIASASTELFSREARASSGLYGERVDTISGKQPRFLRTKKLLDIDAEQPNSLFRLFNRFTQRKSDINNSRVLAEIIKSPENQINYRTLKGKRTLKLDRQTLNIVDEAGNPAISRSDVLRAVDAFRKENFPRKLNRRIMTALEEQGEGMFVSGDIRASRISSVEDARSAIVKLEGDLTAASAELRMAGQDPTQLRRFYSRLQRYTSSSVDDLDEARSEIFRFIAQKNEALRTAVPSASITPQASEDVFTKIVKVTRQLRSEGKIGLDESIEAQSYAIATLFNFSAFKTYRPGLTPTKNSEAALRQVLSQVDNNENVRDLFKIYTSGSISMVGTSIRRPFSRGLPLLSRAFGSAPYQLDKDSINVLGSGQQYTMMPTFGTAFARRPLGAIKSSLGIGTYRDPESFSTGSVPVSHMFGRLNKYFGTFGMQLDQSQYGGPIDMYMRGMVAKRVLPLTVAGASFMAVDRTIGGMVNERDQRGERVYSPFFTTKLARAAVEGQSIGAGLVPGGMSYEEKRDQLLNGEVPIRQGRFWPLGTTPFQGGKVMYYRPSYYRKLKEGTGVTSDNFDSPIEKLMFGYDFSPLRPLDPYRFERENYYTRPYPVTGEYFSGPYGPAVPLANLTIGRLLKPQVQMHEQEVSAGLANYVPAGQAGAYDASGLLASGRVVASRAPQQYGGGITSLQSSTGGYSAAGSQIGTYNRSLSMAAGPMATATNQVRGQIAGYNNQLSTAYSYGPPKVSGIIPPAIVSAQPPIDYGSVNFQASELGYRLQETAGIYGFATGSLREKFGFGGSDFSPQASVLQSAAKGYGSTRAFWDLNLGGLGDVPLAGEGQMGNIEISEIVRRFIPKERTDVNYINPIPNLMGQQYPFLPGPEYFTNFKTGDPFTRVQEGEIRLPGVGYERFNTLYGDETGRYGRVNQLDILADVAPYSTQFRSLDRSIKMGELSPAEKLKVQQIREQVAQTTTKYQFSPYKYKGTTPEEMDMNPNLHMINRFGEYIAHRDTFFNTKFLNKRTATEDWERRNVYGATFPEWQRPYESFIEPMVNKASQRDPLVATIALAGAGSLFGTTKPAKTFGSIVGGLAGFASSVRGNVYEAATGQRYMPEKRKKEIALEEYIDILSYTKNTSLAQKAEAANDSAAAAMYRSAAKRTMYGADIYGASVDTLSLAVPKRKREHFKAMINAPEEERGRILSTAGRLERRIYQAAWGMPVEERPDLAEYFSRHQLPDASWEGWHPNTNMEHVKIKMGQSMGLEMSQMGYYPQQIREANLVNPSYPSFFDNRKEEDAAQQIRAMMSRMGVSGSVNRTRNPYGNNSINLSAGVR